MKNFKGLFLTLSMLFVLSVIAGSEQPSPDWKDTLKWLETYYYIDENSPNYDWPESVSPKVINGFIYSIDGTAFPVLKGAYDVSMGGGTDTNFCPFVGLGYYVKYSSKTEAKKVFEKMVQFFQNNYGVDIYSLSWEQNYGLGFKITGKTENIEIDEISVQGDFSGKTPIFSSGSGFFKISYNLKGTYHFYFSRNHLRVVDNKVALSDGTIVPIISSNGKVVYPILNVEVNNMQEQYNEVLLQYSYTVTDGGEYDNEFVRLYSLYAKHFGFSVNEYKIWDTSDVFIIHYENASIEIRIQASGQPVDKTGLHTNWQKEQGWTYLWVEIFFKGKKQIIPDQRD